ncbi:DUF1697 domain-containing protein [Niveispirillum sp. KHB5.9]|uniref:DUF1697 domain-containing protein n=1 Tax=Niveispirillum sp. KHB5.9 TaxID=3400269 RepID=UPI003A88C3BC
MTTHVCLLRGVNVGGNKIVKMALWKQLYEEMGFTRVRTLLQSGNIVFDAQSGEGLAERLPAAFAARFGFTADHVLRDATALEAAIAGNPFPDAAEATPNHLLVFFLSGAPDKAAAERLAALIGDGPARLHLSGDVLYLDFAGAILQKAIDPVKVLKAAGVTGTSRNWTTLGKLAALARA